jgi:glycosyltransferase A (GT-A) superfamily protein (DUF2064 family)
MPAIKDILKHVRVEQARGKRTCSRHRKTHVISKGDLCLVVQNGQDEPNYCIECAAEILRLAQENLNTLQLLLDQTHTPSRS